ncbi:HAD family hydrolase [Gelidibacter gilvus]|uniref:HAD family phosphatase n=1 Tax=Gelidibacter gilvus TaxID=59602 RepID=A0A4V1LN38_9FLAO|nr:HAD family phosphatase [Gelidibacter gilvus]RXJ50736.1 HAD family phosphatase [Gelidibacter gilvus]
MIKNIIFDFGDVFINLDKKGAMDNVLNLFEMNELSDEIHAINILYEQGLMSTDEFLEFYLDNFPDHDRDALLDSWNYILRDFPLHRLEFLEELAADKKYKLILLSNTNELHINWVKENVNFYEEFKAQFDAFYLSHEIQLRKPNANIYEFVLKENNIKAEETLFIDDTEENIVSASKLGIHTWHINPETDDITSLMSTKSDLF